MSTQQCKTRVGLRARDLGNVLKDRVDPVLHLRREADGCKHKGQREGRSLQRTTTTENNQRSDQGDKQTVNSAVIRQKGATRFAYFFRTGKKLFLNNSEPSRFPDMIFTSSKSLKCAASLDVSCEMENNFNLKSNLQMCFAFHILVTNIEIESRKKP